MILRALKHPLFRILLAGAILAVLLGTGRFNLEAFGPVAETWPLVTLGGLLMLPCFGLAAYRFQLLLGGVGLACRFGKSLSWTMIGSFFDLVMPSATGGDLVRIVLVAKAFGKGQRGVAATAVLVDRILGMLGLFLFGLLASLANWGPLAAQPELRLIPWILLAICLGSAAGFLLFTAPLLQNSRRMQAWVHRLPGGQRIEKVYRGFAGFRRRPGLLLGLLGLSVLNHALLSVCLLFFTKALKIEINLVHGLVVFPLAMFANVFGFAGGIGTGTAAFEFLFTHCLGLAKGLGAAVATLYHGVGILLRFVFGLPFYLIGEAPREIAEMGGPPAEDRREES